MLVVLSKIRCCSVKAQHESSLASLLVFMTWVGPRPLCCKLIVLITKAIHHQKSSFFIPQGRGRQEQTWLQDFLSLQGNKVYLQREIRANHSEDMKSKAADATGNCCFSIQPHSKWTYFNNMKNSRHVYEGADKSVGEHLYVVHF